MKTKLLIVPLLTILSFSLLSSQAHAVKITLEGEDVKLGREKVKNSKLTQSATTLLDEVWTEIRTFVYNGLHDISNQQLASVQDEKTAYIKQKPLEVSYSSLGEKSYFSDIAHDVHKKQIQILAQREIINSASEKYYPHNHVRLHECVKMLLRSCEEKLGKEFTPKNISSLSATPEHYQIADSLGMLDNIATPEKFERILNANDYKILLDNFTTLYPELGGSFGKGDKREVITRSDMAGMLVELFDLSALHEPDLNVKILIGHTMYPFSEVKKGVVTRQGFAQFLAQVHSRRYGNNLAAELGNKIYADVKYDQHSYMYYLQNQKLIDYLSESKRGTTYFYPERAITKHEVYHILSTSLDQSLTYNEVDADEQTINFDELSALFVKIISHKHSEEENTGEEKTDFWGELAALFV